MPSAYGYLCSVLLDSSVGLPAASTDVTVAQWWLADFCDVLVCCCCCIALCFVNPPLGGDI